MSKQKPEVPRGSFPVDVNPAVMRWARESAGYSVSDIANYIRVPEDVVAGWERGRKKPSWSALRKLSQVYRRPIASLLLPAPPDEPPLPTDFRTLPNASRELSPAARFAIRNARWLVRTAAELEQQLGVTRPFVHSRIQLGEDPEPV